MLIMISFQMTKLKKIRTQENIALDALQAAYSVLESLCVRRLKHNSKRHSGASRVLQTATKIYEMCGAFWQIHNVVEFEIFANDSAFVITGGRNRKSEMFQNLNIR